MTQEQKLKNLVVPRDYPIDCVLDTDAYNEIDDQFAIAFMVKHEALHVKALYAAPFLNNKSTSPADGMERSYQEIHNLLTLMEHHDMKEHVYRGSTGYLKDEKTPVDSEAARHLIALAMEYSAEKPLYVVAIGAITNVASALLLCPEIAERIVVVWLGGNDVHWLNTIEFNMRQDVAAARVVFSSGCPLVQLPCMGVVSSFYTTDPELRKWLGGKNALCDYLVDHSIEEMGGELSPTYVWSRVIWDVTAVAWLLNRDDIYMHGVIEPMPMPTYDGFYEYEENSSKYLRVMSIHRDALFRDLFAVLAK